MESRGYKVRACKLLGCRNPQKGTIISDYNVWNGRDDPLFTVALDVVSETFNSNEVFDWDLKPLFRLEMAYLLLWTAIERYTSLRYHLGDRANQKGDANRGRTSIRAGSKRTCSRTAGNMPFR